MLLQCLLEVMERTHLVTLVFADPAVGNFMDRHRVEVMPLFAPPPDRDHEVGRFKQGEVLGHGLPRHVYMSTEFAKGLAVVLVQPVQQLSAAGVGESFEHFVHVRGHAILCNHLVACQE